MVNGADSTFNREEWAAAYQNTDSHPEGFWLRAAEGEIPAGLAGTYFRNGPGMFTHGKDRVAHPFDGHGLVASISFSKGKAYFRSKFVRTQAFKDETSEGRILYKGTFGTKVPGGLKNNLFRAFPRNPANTGVITLGSQCLALFEAGQPHTLDPETLITQGVSLLGGNVSLGAPFSTGWAFLDRFVGLLLALLGVGAGAEGGNRLGGDAVCAHPVTDPVSGNTMLFTFRLQLGLVACSLRLFTLCLTLWLPGLVTRLAVREFDENLVQQSVVHATLPGYCFLHDMGMTATKYVAFLNPVRLHMLPLLLGIRCPIHCIRWRGTPASIVLLDRPSSQAAAPSAACQATPTPFDAAAAGKKSSGQRQDGLVENAGAGRAGLHAGPAFVFHQANAYEDGSMLTVDAIRYPRMPDFEQANGSGDFLDCVDPELQPISQLWRYEIDLESGCVNERMLSARAMEFPVVNPCFTGQKHRYIYAAAALHASRNMPQQAICKLDTHTLELQLWDMGPRCYMGEPVFVPFPSATAEDDGWILSIVYDASVHSSECVILDARGLQVVTRLPLCHTLPHGLHGSWQDISYVPAQGPSAASAEPTQMQIRCGRAAKDHEGLLHRSFKPCAVL